ncbi:MAG: hypothetical protein CSB44_05295 [Gammaproteobacteria bacterium]|nr:MAG: hypothetical protein CSB44_05295 [Gammaproteobacteria bacterium]
MTDDRHDNPPERDDEPGGNDPLLRLGQALDELAPTPDPARRANTITLALDAFERHQGNASEARLNPEPTTEQGFGHMNSDSNTSGTTPISNTTASTDAPGASGASGKAPSSWKLRPTWVAVAATITLAVTVVPLVIDHSDDDTGEPIVASRDETALTLREDPTSGNSASEETASENRAGNHTANEASASENPASDNPAGEKVASEIPASAEESLQIEYTASNKGFAQETAIESDGASAARVATAADSAAADLAAPSAAAAPFTAQRRGESAGLTVRPVPDTNTESFANAAGNPLKITREAPVSTFSIDVDTASWSTLRNSLMQGMLPPPEAIRIEEMINYFDYVLPAPEGDTPFAVSYTVEQTPWNADTKLLSLALQGKEITARPPLNLVFLIDTSGSMDQPNKLPLLVQSLKLLLGRLGPDDEIAIVTYAGSAGLVLEPTAATDGETIAAALENLQAGGGTAGQAGLQQAYATARKMSAEGEVSRIVLATDGDFNIGISDPEALTDYIADKREQGSYLSVLGFGRGNLDDTTMQALAQNGNGQAAYIDTLAEAQKVLVDQFDGALFPIADDVKIQVEFNPEVIAEYRLIGYETRALAREDFSNDAVDAGEIGAGHQVVALYEVTPVGSPAVRVSPLRYGSDGTKAAATTSAVSDDKVAADGDASSPGDASGNAATAAGESTSRHEELAFLKLRYKQPGESRSMLVSTPIVASPVHDPDADAAATGDLAFAAAIAGFGQLLRGDDKWLGDWGIEQAIALALAHRGDDEFGYRQEAIQLMRLADGLGRF